MYPTRDNWVVGNTFLQNRIGVSLGGALTAAECIHSSSVEVRLSVVAA